ncbi:MAG TPA: hypothetical protein VHR66_21735 [Gemmataceae bacterium]|nr:hypothetical protein [Gemmataceae bacterium]
MTQLRAAFALLVLAGPLRAEPPAEPVRADEPTDFFTAVGLTRRPDSSADVWKVTEAPTQFAWMTESGPLPAGTTANSIGHTDPFQQILDRMSDAPDRSRPNSLVAPGLIVDPGRWSYKQVMTSDFFSRKSKLEVPDPQEVGVPYGQRNWKAQEKVQIPVPIPVPLAEQMFVYGQFDGSGDPLTHQQTSISSKSGVGVKWALIAGSELQVRYATLTSYDQTAPGRVQPAFEVLAKLPLVGPLQLEYTGSAIPAITRLDPDSLKQELRLAYPLSGDNELEFGARYRWDVTGTPTPWVDRAQLFLGVKFRH